MSSLQTIDSVVAQALPDLSEHQRAALTGALIERENQMADMFRLAGMQFGLFPQIVAEVFAEVGIGSPVDDTQRAMIRDQFVALMSQLEQQFREGQG